MTGKMRIYQDAPVGVAKQTFDNVVAAAQIAYLTHNRDPKNRDGRQKTTPKVEDIAKFCQHTEPTVARIVGTTEFLTAMRERGIYWDAAKGLTPEQVYALGIMTDPSSKKDLAGKLKSAGITMQTYRAWLKQPLFKAAIDQIGQEMLSDHVADVQTAVVSNAINGNMKAIEIYHQLTGQFDPQKKQIEDLQRMVSLLLETIFRYVQDTTTLALINRDFEKIMQGKVPDAELIVDGEVVTEHFAEVVDEGETVTEQPPVVDASIPEGFFDFTDEKDFDI